MQLEIDSEQVTGGVRIVDRSLPQCYQGVAIVIQRDPHPTLGHGITHDQAVERSRVMAASFELLEALEATNAQMRIAYECVEAGRYDEALLHLGSMPRQRTEAIAKARGA